MKNIFRLGNSVVLPNAREDPLSDDEKLNPDKAIAAGAPAVVKIVNPDDHDTADKTFTANAQYGVMQMEAIATVWSKNQLILAYILMWLVTFVDATQQGASGTLNTFVTSAFQQHSLTAYTGVMSGIIGGVIKIPLAKIIDVFGRVQGFAVMVAFLIIGLIMMAATDGVQMYAGAQIFYWVGYNGVAYIISIFIADTSRLKNRGFMYAYVSSPYIITVWITGPLAEAFLAGPGWRWFYGAFAIITLIPTVPLGLLFWWNYRKALKQGIITPVVSGRTFAESARHYFIEFDIGGLFLLTGGLVFFLLPFSLWSYQDGLWKSPLVVSFFIIGGLMLVGFVLYEKYVAVKSLFPYELLLDRTVLGACILAAVLFISFYLWNAYFASFLLVVTGLTVTTSTYVVNIYSIGACVFSLVVGVLIRVTGRYKWIAVYCGVPFTMLGCGLMIHYRQPNVNVGYVVLSQILIAFGGGACVITQQIAAMAATDHQHVAIVLALEGMFSSVGGGIGQSIAASIWTGVFPGRLAYHLPASAQADLLSIYGDIQVQLSYAKGTPERLAIELAYGDSQRYMAIAATTILVLGLAAAMSWRNINLKNYKQVKGRVF